MTDLLNLPNWSILKIDESDRLYLVRAEYTISAPCCPHCGFMIRYGHGTKEKLFMDTPMHGKRVGIMAVRQRYKCQNCGKTYYQPLADMNEDRNMTNRLISYIEREAFKRTFLALADDIGVDEKTIRNVFSDYVNQEEKKRILLAPYWLGMDELKLAGKQRGIFSNVKDHCILDMANERTQKTVTKFLEKLPEKERIQLVCMDMWEPYKNIVRVQFPKADVVVDKFHWVRMASQALEKIRKSVREGLTDRQRRQLMHDRFLLLKRKKNLEPKDMIIMDSWLGFFPLLKEAYDLKEELYEIWDLRDRKEAEKQYADWQTKIPADGLYAFAPMVTAMSNWRTELFNYFDHQATNAYTESLNGVIKTINHQGRGYSFEVIRARILYKTKIPKLASLRKGIFADQQGYIEFPPSGIRREHFNGARISTLMREVQDDHFLPIPTGYSE